MKRLINFIIFYLAVGSVSKFIQLTKRMRNKAKSSFIRNLVLTCFYPIESVLWGLLLVYITYFIARIVFFVGNYDLFPDMALSHIFELFKGGLLFDTSAILYTNAIWIILLLLPLHYKETKSMYHIDRLIFIIINVSCLTMNLMDTVYFRYTIRRTTTTIFQEFSNEGNIGKILLEELVAHWYYLLLVLLVALLLYKLYIAPQQYLDKLKEKGLSIRWYYLIMLISLLSFAPFCVAGMRGGWTDSRPITISKATAYCNRPSEVGIVLNTPFSLIRTIGDNKYEVVKYFHNRNTLNSLFNPIHSSVGNNVIRNKNIVILIVESFGREYIGAYNKHIPGYKGYTPFVDSLINNCALTYRYSYCNGQNSVDGMPSILSSIPMFIEHFFLSPYSVNHVSGMADCLNKMGYESAFFHGAERGSMGFLGFARATKFKHYYGREDYVKDSRTHRDADYDGLWGISDEPFMQYFCMKISEMKQPFMATLFTLSSHHPYRVPDPYKDIFKEENPEMPIYKVIRYTDMSLRKFFNSARQQSWFKNTIFVLLSDHTNISALAEYNTDIGVFCSPIILYDPSGEIGKGMIDGIAQQVDIMPTILNYLGYDQPYLSFGKDLFSTPLDSTWAVNYLNGVYQYVKYGHILQFDGQHTRAVYSLEDRLMKKNIIGKFPKQNQMERELKAIIQQYMERMTENRLTPDS